VLSNFYFLLFFFQIRRFVVIFLGLILVYRVFFSVFGIMR